MNAHTPIRRARHATTFRAWRVTESGASLPLDAGDATTLTDAVAAALSCGQVVLHKETLLVHEMDEGRGRGMLHGFAIKRRARVEYRYDAAGNRVALPSEYPAPTFQIEVDAFEPTRPFDALRDDPRGVDLTLVEARS